MYIDVSNVSISFEENKEQHTILNDVSLQVEKGEFICLLGPSGCGKSTLLNAMAGFLKPSSGEIKIDGQTVEKPSMKYVTIFQNYGLLPWRSVQKNVELGLETKKLGKEEKKKITDHYLEMVGLKEAAKKRPAQLSGDMQQEGTGYFTDSESEMLTILNYLNYGEKTNITDSMIEQIDLAIKTMEGRKLANRDDDSFIKLDF